MNTDASSWLGVHIVLPEAEPLVTELAVDELSALLMEMGAMGLETIDKVLPVKVVASFTESEPVLASERVKAGLEEAGFSYQSIEAHPFAAVDWSTHWKQHFKPLAFGALWVVPTWLDIPTEAEKSLRIDPSSAFGTGLHQTTALCIQKVVELSPTGRALDVGTGTGILAMAAVRMGAPSAVGVDNDPEAVRVSIENAEINQLEDSLELSETPVEEISETFPLVIANILAGPLVELAPAIASRVAEGGRLMLSGILHHQAQQVGEAYLAQGLSNMQVTRKDEWVRIDFERN